MTDWARYIATKQQLEESPQYAEKFLATLSRNWGGVPLKDQDSIRELFVQKKCIPTKYGMKTPLHAYFPNVNLFQDLPIIFLQNQKSVNEKLLLQLGVRKVSPCVLYFNIFHKKTLITSKHTPFYVLARGTPDCV